MGLSDFEKRVVQDGHRLGLDLCTVRAAAESLLRAIPTAGFFRTYSDHSIRHCEQMFNVLMWLLPVSIRNELTHPEHALLTLAVYFHDLGMLATEEEFRDRAQNSAFQRFEKLYTQHYDPASRKEADHASWDRFLFEEFLRHTHAQRIADWITGRRPALPQAVELQALLHRATPPFSHYLATVCKSHHLNNLHDRGLYPVDARFGNAPGDRANIQFIAIALRLADILHMSRDRTPPLEFRLISPRNPVSAREWAKQLQVAGVGPSDNDPTEIRIEALCTDHRMYFYLQDFIRTVNDELQRCRAWLAGAPGDVARKYYLAHRVVSDAGIRAEGFLAEKFQLELDQRRVIDLLMGHNLYGDAKVAIRELAQNSIDAVRVRARETAGYVPTLSLHLNREARTLTILDNGIGMDLDVIRRHFLRVGDSYYRSQAFRRRCPGYSPISQFGIGFLTAFMLGDRVEVVTRSNRPDAKTYALNLENIYDLFLVRVLEDHEPEAQPVQSGGTKITVFLREDSELGNLRDQVEKWLVFLEFPIHVSVDDAPPEEVWGLRGETVEEIGQSILELVDGSLSQFCPIYFSRDDVHVTVLWEGAKSGDRYLLAPAGRLLLPLTDAYSWLSTNRHFREKEPKLIQKVANGGVFLSNELPGLKFKGRANIHYVIDCRGDRRLTPLVSRSGVAIDNSCTEIVSFVVEGLVDRIGSNVTELLQSGVSKYFTAYYAGQALSELFDYQRTESPEEMVLSVLLALRSGMGVPTALIKEGNDIRLKTWGEHHKAPICIGQNVYAGLLRSVTYGYVEFPLPAEVLESLPEYFLVDVGTDAVLKPMFILSGYGAVSLEYDGALKGVFIRCEVKREGDVHEEFGGLRVLPFPDGLQDAIAVTFPLAGCMNKNHEGLALARRIVGEIAGRGGESVRAKAEETMLRILKEVGWEWKHGPHREDPEEELRRIKHILISEFDDFGAVQLRPTEVALLAGARVIRRELWSYDV